MKTIGQVEDIKGDSTIYFNKEESAIYRYYPLYDRIDLVLQDPLLNFNKPIDAEIISDLLYWTDDDTEPKKINIIKAQAYSNPWNPDVTYYPMQIVGYQGKAYQCQLEQTGALISIEQAWELVSDTIYETITDELLWLIKAPDKLAPVAVLGNYTYNPSLAVLHCNTYQFAKRIIYGDGEKSVLSDYSVPIVAYKTDQPEPGMPWIEPVNLPRYTHILVRYMGDQYLGDAKSIQILVRKMTADNAWSLWGVVKTMPVGDVEGLYFSGGEVAYVISTDESSAAYHNVPKKIASICSVDEGKRLAVANYTDGFDQVVVDATVSEVIVDTYSEARKYELMNRNDLFFHRYNGQFGIVYKDAGGRLSPVYTGDGLKIQINNSVTEFTGIEWEINHRPPSWATSYRWVRSIDYSNNGYTFYRYYPYYIEDTQVIEPPVEGKGHRLSFAQYFNHVLENKHSYEIEVGDLVKFYGFERVSVVKEINTEDIYIDSIPSGLLPETSIEIYKAGSIDLENVVFYEFGQSYPIVNGLHAGPVQYQTSSLPATGVFTQGNTFYTNWINRGVPIHGESVNKFDDHLALGETGRANVVNEESKETKYPNYIKKSSTYFDNTLTNGLSDFDFTSTPLNERYGEIVKMMEIGIYTLKVIQRAKITSIYLGKEVIKSGTDGDMLATTDQTFGSIRVPEENYGSIFKDSIVKSNRQMYLFDIFSGTVVRDAPNGMFPISTYGMGNFFKELSRSLLTSGIGNVNVFATFDSKHDEFLITFVDSVNSLNNQTWVFHEPSNSWTFQYDIVPELWASRGQYVMSFKDGEVWKNEVSEVRNEFFGVKYPLQITPVFNEDPMKYKTFRACFIEGNGSWASPEITVIKDQTNKRGMQSRLSQSKFKWINGAQYAPYMRDMLTKSLTPDVSQLVEGRELRGKWLQQQFESWTEEEVVVAALVSEASVNEISGGLK